MIVGATNRLEVKRIKSPGAFLSDSEGKEVLLPTKYIPSSLEVGGNVDVFVYLDSEDRLIATTLSPKLRVGEFGYLRVKDMTKVGAFLDWGLEKDLLLPFSEQRKKPIVGETVLVSAYVDEKTGRLVATQKVERFLEKEEVLLEANDTVDLLVCETTDVGTKVIVDNKYEGLLYENEIFADLLPGDRTAGFVKKVRADKKIDVMLQLTGLDNLEEGAKKILLALESKGDFLGLTDKSSPEEIQFELQMSKKNFKRSVGILYKKRLVELKPDGIAKL